MTFEEFLIESMNTPTPLRRGQFACNLLYKKRPDLAARIFDNHPELDPFYRDTNIPKFMIWVGENWNTTEGNGA